MGVRLRLEVVVHAGPGSSNKGRLALALALLVSLLAALAPAAANANPSIAVSPGLPTDVSVGDTNVSGTVTIRNASDGGDTSITVCEPGDPAPCTGAQGTTLIPSCSSMDIAQNCLLSGANPGVFSIHPTATGGTGTACATKTFTVSVVDGTFGKVRFAPSGGNVVLPTQGSSCRIEFQFDVLQLPVDGSGAAGYQTLQRAEAAGYSNLGTGAFNGGTQLPVNVTLAAPTVNDTDPDSPANDNQPEVKGTAPAGTTQVRVYNNAACTGTPIVQGLAGTFASPGLTAPVNDDTTTTFFAAVVDNLGGVSDCSSTGITYIEDSTPPGTPVISASDPGSPANNNAPRIKGAADAGSTVRLYTNATCTSSVAAQGPAATFASPGVPVTVANDTTTTFYATATDTAANASGCSTVLVYVEDSTPPAAPSPTGTNPASPFNDNTPQIVGTAETGSTVRIYTSPTCTGALAGQGSAATFASAGIPTTAVSDNITTTFYVTATDAAGNVSPCSAGVTYVEDSVAPAGPVVSGTSPASPANNNSPRVTGSAPAGTTVKLYTDAACTSAVAGEGSAAAFASPGFAVSVVDDSTTTFYARATDAASNVSGCSPSSATYVEDSTLPQNTIDGGPTGSGASATPTFTFSSTEAGVTFECRIDNGVFAPCTSPFTTGTLAAGPHTFEVRARDSAGNAGPTATRQFTVAGSVTPPPPPGPTPPPPPPAQPGCAGIVGTLYIGTSAPNIRNGSGKTDIMFGLAGNDSLRGAAGLDCLYGGAGTDSLSGGSGPDRLFGGIGNDRLDGLSGNDRLSGESGNDRLNGGSGNDGNTGGAGRDIVLDRRGTDRFSGGSGNDRIDARDATLAGRRGVDRILCGAGVDTVLADPRDSIARDCERGRVTRRSLKTIAAR